MLPSSAVLERFDVPIPEEVRVRGERFAADGRVRLTPAPPAVPGTGDAVRAVVLDNGSQYETRLAWNNGSPLRGDCGCDTFARRRLCPHVVATALAAERQGMIPPRPAEGPAPEQRETRPRRGDRGAAFLTSTGQLRRIGDDDEDEPRPVIVHQPSPPSWKKQLTKVREQAERDAAEGRPSSSAERAAGTRGASSDAWPPDRQVLYVVDIPASAEAGTLVVRLAARDRKSSGEWSRPKTRGVTFPPVAALREAADRQVVALLRSADPRPEPTAGNYEPSYRVPEPLQRMVIEQMCRTGRALVVGESDGADEAEPLAWDDGEPYEFVVRGVKDETAEQYVLSGWLARGADDAEGGRELVPVTRPALVLAGGGVVLLAGRAAAFEDAGAHAWVRQLRATRTIAVPVAQASELVAEILSIPHLPRLELPEELRVETVTARPVPRLRVRAAGRDEFRPERLRAELTFDYEGTVVRQWDGPAGTPPPRNAFDPARRRMVVRDAAAERQALERLLHLGMREARDHSRGGGPELWFNQRHLPRVIRALVNEGWHVEADGKLYRRAARFRLDVGSGIDWFELRGEVDFGDGRRAALPELLAALRKGQTSVRLEDGTMGLVPDAWLRRYGLLAAVGEAEGEVIRFGRAQVGLLDALLASEPEGATCDETFEKLRRELRRFDGIAPADAPAGFAGELRPYQREGLGWFAFLRRFGFGGCLADDMGLGKTVQVLALLAERYGGTGAEQAGEASDEATKRRSDEGGQASDGATKRRSDGGEETAPSVAPSLIVVPKSLVFNWKQEAARFTPGLRVLDHTGIDRVRSAGHLADYHVILTTYGTLRRDAAFLKDVTFEYVVLDEAQAVKNPASESAKAVRLVKGRHRLALSGTPVQNHLGDLWSLFDFLNPGMMGAAGALSDPGSSLRHPDPESRQVLARALRPFILRRTKEQVAADLPAKLEQTIYCELEGTQRKLYDELRDHYRRSLLEQIDRDGIGGSKMQILEALLRLRQAALHPALVDRARAGEPSAKLDMLLPRLAEVVEEGHKALVFSQFTSMLALVREQLDREGVAYEYLDGKTKDRESRVARFQEDGSCKLFLISLKAGGLGLNLTAADYVFLLDPWWNPAVEAQAIDRAHRIGQTKQVFACRLIAKDTVEEKVLALQRSKRDLADAIINADNSLIRNLGREDLELLLS